MVGQRQNGVLGRGCRKPDVKRIVVSQGVKNFRRDGAGESVASMRALVGHDNRCGIFRHDVFRFPQCGIKFHPAVKTGIALVLRQLVVGLVERESPVGNAPGNPPDGGAQTEVAVDVIILHIIKAQDHIFAFAMAVRSYDLGDRCAELRDGDPHAAVVLKGVKMDERLLLCAVTGRIRISHRMFYDIHKLTW